MKKIICFAVLLMGLTFGAQSFAQDYYGNVGVSTDYFWRGVAMNKSNPSIYGGGAVEKGFLTVGAWAAQTDIGIAEYDLFVSAHETLGDFQVSGGAIRYAYVDNDVDALNEAYFGVGYGPLNVKYFNDLDSDAGYWQGALRLPTAYTVVPTVEYGKNVDGIWTDAGTDFFALALSKNLGKVEVVGRVYDFIDVDAVAPLSDFYEDFVEGASVAVQYNFE
jgi:uncharacterized protein (TIGR02001 family)